MKSLDFGPVKDFFINFLTPLGCLAGSAFLIAVVAYPSFKGLPAANAELQQKQALKNQLDTKLVKLNSLVDYKSVVDENSNLIGGALVDEPEVPQLLTQVHQIASDSGLTVETLNYSVVKAPTTSRAQVAEGAEAEAKPAEPAYQKVNVSLGVNGNYDQIVAFLENIEQASRLVLAESVRFSTGTDDDAVGYKISFALASPYLKVQSNAVTDDPIDLNMGDKEFVTLINNVKGMRYYDISIENANLNLVQEAEETEQSTPSETAAVQGAETQIIPTPGTLE